VNQGSAHLVGAGNDPGGPGVVTSAIRQALVHAMKEMT
jgi:hypothetical protein